MLNFVSFLILFFSKLYTKVKLTEKENFYGGRRIEKVGIDAKGFDHIIIGGERFGTRIVVLNVSKFVLIIDTIVKALKAIRILTVAIF